MIYGYTPYGDLTILDADFSVDGDQISDLLNVTTFTGRSFDAESGLFYYRNRYYNAKLGQFVSRDPSSYEGSKWNLYEYTSSQPVNSVDPMGLARVIFSGIITGKIWYQFLAPFKMPLGACGKFTARVGGPLIAISDLLLLDYRCLFCK